MSYRDIRRHYYCLNGPRKGSYLLQEEAEGYLLYNRSSYTILDKSKRGYHFTDAPTGLLIYVDDLPLSVRETPRASRLG
jgi:hypothetical protein